MHININVTDELKQSIVDYADTPEDENIVDIDLNNMLTLSVYENEQHKYDVNIYVPNDFLGYFLTACEIGLYQTAEYVYKNGLERSNMFEVILHYVNNVTNNKIKDDLMYSRILYKEKREFFINLSTNIEWLLDLDIRDTWYCKLPLTMYKYEMLSKEKEKRSVKAFHIDFIKENIIEIVKATQIKYKGFEKDVV